MVVKPRYQKIERERLYEGVAGHIEELVSSGELRPGDKLPAERELGERLGVGRGVVREAVKVLAERGLVSVEPGRGTFVIELGRDLISQHLARLFRMGVHRHTHLNEVRRILEVEIASLAAQRAKTENIEKMYQALEEMDENMTSPEAFIEADLAFHSALSEATQNEVLPLLLEPIVDLLRASRRLIFQVPGAPARGQGWHRRIYEAVRNGDVDAARECMAAHMEQVRVDAKRGEDAQSRQAGRLSSVDGKPEVKKQAR